MTQNIGVVELTPEQFKEKQKAIQAAPNGYKTLVTNALAPNGFAVADHDPSAQRATISHTVSAINQVLALLNFPHRLRGYLDTLLGLARNCEGNEFSATNKEVSKALRSGRKGSTDETAERTLRRLKKDLNDWQQEKNFLLVKVTPGKFKVEEWKNETTKYEIPLLSIIDEVLQEARANPFFSRAESPQNLRRLQGLAIRKAAFSVLFRIPNAPSLKPEPKRTLSKDELFDRRHNAINTFEKNNCSDLAISHLNQEEYRFLRLKEMEENFDKQPVTIGGLVIPDLKPEIPVSIISKIKRGELTEYLMERFPDENSDLKVIIFNPENDPKVLISNTEEVGTEYTLLSPPLEEVIPMKQTEVLPILEAWKTRINEKVPALGESRSGWEITWQIFGLEAERTQEALNISILKCEQRNLNMLEVKERFLDYVMARVKFIRNGVQFPQPNSKLIEFRQKLSSFLQANSEG